jgi:nucleotide-binding universal stress UspA family protein
VDRGQAAAPGDEDGHGDRRFSDKLWAAVRTVIVADFVMSVDNVIAIAGAAESAGGDHKMPLVIFGLLVSIPIIVWGSQFVIKLMDRFPVVITIGGMLLGWIAGTMAVGDPAAAGFIPQAGPGEAIASVRYGAGVAGALLVLMHVHLINVQRAVSGNVVSFVGTESVEEFHQENSEDALAPARAQLRAADCPCTEHQRVGSPGPLIAEVAQAEGCDLIIMGTRGLGSASAALLGSVTQAVLEHTRLPVLLTK